MVAPVLEDEEPHDEEFTVDITEMKQLIEQQIQEIVASMPYLGEETSLMPHHLHSRLSSGALHAQKV